MAAISETAVMDTVDTGHINTKVRCMLGKCVTVLT